MKNSNNLGLKRPVEIGILEIQRHTPVLYTFCRICKTKNTNVTIFTTKELFIRLEKYLKNKQDYDVVLKRRHENKHAFLKRVEHICNQKIDLLFINTIHETILDLANYLSFNPKSKMILTVHHVNSWLKPRLVFNIKHIIRTINTNFSSILISKFIFPKFDAINVIYHPLKDYIQTNTDFEKEVFTIPTSIFENHVIKGRPRENEKLVIVIPGLIQEHRKDYTAIFPAFKKLFEQYNEKIRLYILGFPVERFGRQVYRKFKDMKQKQYDVVIFDKFIPDDIFYSILKQSDIILAPIRIKSRADGEIEEIYGKTVGSGVVYNSILYAKPIIVPAEFNMLPELKTSTLNYTNSMNLEKIIKELISKPKKLQQLKKEAFTNSQKFSLKNLQDYFEREILTWAKNY
jgi:glycosyltransferase involved in cell wall biosynthesis